VAEETASDAYNRGFDDGLYMARNRELQVELRAAMRAEVLADVLDALRDEEAFHRWRKALTGERPEYPPPSTRYHLADYLAERFGTTTAPEGADERNGHGHG
jgi:hypothetical protein